MFIFTIMNSRYTYILAILLGIIALPDNFAIEPGKPASTVNVTYIANEGFLIEVKDKKILIDALYGEEPYAFCDNPTEEALRDMVDSNGAFEDVDLVVATHMHRDHFYAPFVADHMSSNQSGCFISCEQSVDLLSTEEGYDNFSDRVIEMTPDSLMYKDTIINDIGVRVYRLAHGPYLVEDPETGKTINRHRNIQNLGFLFDIDGVKVFHCGDSGPRCMNDYEHFRLDKEEIDIAFMGRGFLSSTSGFGIEILRNQIKANHIILMHIHHDQNPYFKNVAKQVEDEFPSVTIFESLMDSKTF